MPYNIRVQYVKRPTEKCENCMNVSDYRDSSLSHKIRGGVISLISWISLVYISIPLTLLLRYSTEVEQAFITV